MKKVLAYLVMFIMLMFSVLATANVYEAEDFAKYPEQIMILKERDIIRMNWEGKDHKLMIRNIYQDKQKIDLTSFVEDAEVPYYTTLTLRTSLQLDFDQDLEYDIKVSVLDIKDNSVVLNLEKMMKESQISTGAVVTGKPGWILQNIKNNVLYLFLGIALLGLGVWKRRFILKTYRKLKK